MKIAPGIITFLKSHYLLLLSAILSFALALYFFEKSTSGFIPTSEKFEKVLHQKQEHAGEELASLSEKASLWTFDQLFSEKPGYYESLFEREGLVFLIFENDSLRFWTDNTVAIDSRYSLNAFNGKMIRLAGGWFTVERVAGKEIPANRQYLALILLKREYPYQNKYLSNDFQSDFSVSADVDIRIDPEKSGSKDNTGGDVHDSEGDYLFTLVSPASGFGSPFFFSVALILNVLGFILVLWFLQSEVDSLKQKIGRGWAVILLSVTVIVLRYLALNIRFPEFLYETYLFSPELYGDASFAWLGSLGDLLINALLFFFLSYYMYRNLSIPERKPGERDEDWFRHPVPEGFFNRQTILAALVLFFVFLFSGIINYIFCSIISNSNIPFNLNDLFGLNRYSFLALFIVSIFLLSYFFILDKTLSWLQSMKMDGMVQYGIFGIAVSAYCMTAYFLLKEDPLLLLWPFLLFFFIAVIRIRFSYSFTVAVVLLFIVSFFSAHVILKYGELREHDSRMIFAQKLSAEQDPLAEHLFLDVEFPISTDTTLIRILSTSGTENGKRAALSKEHTQEFLKTLISKYFSGYWEKYEIRASVFDTVCLPLVQESLPDRDNLNFFEETIANEAVPTESNNFFFLTQSNGRISYLARIPMIETRDYAYRIGDLFIEFDSRVVAEEMGFPELMLDRKLGIANDLLDYSYAKYKDGKLVTYHGKFPYSLSAESMLPPDTGSYPRSSFMDADGFSHLSYSANPESMVIISRKEEGTLAEMTTFSFLFAFFSLVLVLMVLLRFLAFDRAILRTDSFRNRIQYVLVSMVLFSLLFFGAGTVYYIQQQYDRQTRQDVRDKMMSSLVEGMQELGGETELRASKSDYFSYILRRMSNIFLTDISLYDKSGNLVGSSQMRMFDEGLLSRKMRPESFYYLGILQNIEYIHDEKIGNLEYLSAYCSFRNDAGELLGYLNIPYFARQSELEKEISTILSAVINIYVLLFVISVVLALAVSDYFTKPLKLIQEKLSQIKLGRANEPIEWHSQDEIGSLVNEYNRMIDELQRSAELLARSERETAWREMAKQVAHEIKNPLTPMKLSVQHLQRTWMNKDDDRDKKIERITATLIEQIETLSNIAGEFSNFAKMPTSVHEKVNVKYILENCISLFRDSSDAEFVFNTELEEAFVFADKEQILRVCNNLLKNAIQAIPEDRQGKIEVSLVKKDHAIRISIRDNGTGISEDKMSKIFTPNFTTKTGGMGLGLAMVKSIVETIGGKIWFETSRGNGTTFYVSLPEYMDAC